mmetsp:Transcript_25392/g.37446  ORF Transcript_25392/g.37446 Transcript_25392/m.37446 type:complete len:122 (-) Transcript_25392:28-393(-)
MNTPVFMYLVIATFRIFLEIHNRDQFPFILHSTSQFVYADTGVYLFSSTISAIVVSEYYLCIAIEWFCEEYITPNKIVSGKYSASSRLYLMMVVKVFFLICRQLKHIDGTQVASELSGNKK